MKMKVYSLQCPACGADLPIDEEKPQISFCAYCGTRVLIEPIEEEPPEDENAVKEKDVSEEEYDYDFGTEDDLSYFEDFDNYSEHRSLSQKMKNWAVDKVKEVIDDSGLDEVIGWGDNSQQSKGHGRAVYNMEKIKVPREAVNLEGKHYTAIEAAFLRDGFTNIRCVPLEDLRMGLFVKPGTVQSVTVNGIEIESRWKKFYPNAPVVILYHSLYGRV